MLTTKLHMTFKLSLDINVLGYVLAHETRSRKLSRDFEYCNTLRYVSPFTNLNARMDK